MKFLLLSLVVMFSHTSFAHEIDPRCQLGLKLETAGTYPLTTSQSDAIARTVIRVLVEKVYAVQILKADTISQKLNITVTPSIDPITGAGTCSVKFSGNAFNNGTPLELNPTEAPKNYRPKIDPVFDICWDTLTDQLTQHMPHCPYQESLY